MSWTAPRTWVTGEVVRARYFNVDVRDNFRAACWSYTVINTAETTTSTTFTNLTTFGPSLTVEANTEVLAIWGAQYQNTAASALTSCAPDFSGAFTQAASDDQECRRDTRSASILCTYSAAGKWSFASSGQVTATLKYRVSTGTGNFSRRHLLLIATGPAT